ncbi:hypothetical protein ACP70R_040006 [Stipagrostis hirtigluma subsp. patula]
MGRSGEGCVPLVQYASSTKGAAETGGHAGVDVVKGQVNFQTIWATAVVSYCKLPLWTRMPQPFPRRRRRRTTPTSVATLMHIVELPIRNRELLVRFGVRCCGLAVLLNKYTRLLHASGILKSNANSKSRAYKEKVNEIVVAMASTSSAPSIMSEHPLAMVVHDPAAAAAGRRAAKRARLATAMVQYTALPTDVAEPIDAVPLAAIAPPQPPPAREQPPCLRNRILPALRLRADLPVHFIGEKLVTRTDLDGQQNRFRIPTDGVMRHLRPILTHDELADANLLKLEDPAPMPTLQPEPEPENGAAADNDVEQEGEKKKKKKKKQGRTHGGLAVKLVDVVAGASHELRLSRWDSSDGTIVKGKGFLHYIRRCSFKENDVVEIWAFKQRAFRHFGVTMCDESPLHVFIIKRYDQHQIAAIAPPP